MMVCMIPPSMGEDAPPGGERGLFGLPVAPDDGVVFHSPGIAQPAREVLVEADFPVVAPGLGALVMGSKVARPKGIGNRERHPRIHHERRSTPQRCPKLKA